MLFKKLFLVFLIQLCLVFGLRAEDEAISVYQKQESYSIFYRFDKTDIDIDYLSNRETVARIRYYLDNAVRIDSITVYSWASPEGGYPHNRWLSEQRGARAKALLLELGRNRSDFTPDMVKISPLAENWPGLTKMVEENYFRPDRDRVLKVLYTKGISEETRKWRLRQISGGSAWRYLKRNYMKELRSAVWICVWNDSVVPIEPKDELRDTLLTQSKLAPPTEYRCACSDTSKIVFALRTNLLYDAATALNIGVEIPLGEHFSVSANYINPWWAWGPNDRKYAFQVQELGFEGRYYIRPADGRRLTGWYGGVYGSSAQYDFQWDTKLCYQGEYWTAGVSAGYVLPLGRNVFLELGLNFGYLSSDYRHYQPSPDYEHLYRDPYKVGKFTFWGPTRASVTLMVPIYSSYRNSR